MSHRTISLTSYLVVFVLLMLLLGLTVSIGEFEFGRWNFAVAMAIAVVKTLLIVFVFMHVAVSSPLVRMVAFAGVLWFGICIVFMLADYTTRDLATPPGGEALRAAESAADRVESPRGTSRSRVGREPAPNVLQDDR